MYSLSAVSERWRMEILRCHFGKCYTGTENCPSFSHPLADRFRSFAGRLNLIMNGQYLGWNHCLHQQTPPVTPAWVCSIGACSWCRRKLTQKMMKFALKVTHGNSRRKWNVMTSLSSSKCIFLQPGKWVWWNWFVCLTGSWVQHWKC